VENVRWKVAAKGKQKYLSKCLEEKALTKKKGVVEAR
jgi:hypothetical protein